MWERKRSKSQFSFRQRVFLSEVRLHREIGSQRGVVRSGALVYQLYPLVEGRYFRLKAADLFPASLHFWRENCKGGERKPKLAMRMREEDMYVGRQANGGIGGGRGKGW